MHKRVIAAALLWLAGLHPAYAQDTSISSWPQYKQGPGHTAFAEDETLINKDSVGRLRVLWRKLGSGWYAAPAIVNGTIYSGGSAVASYEAETGSFKKLILDESTTPLVVHKTKIFTYSLDAGRILAVDRKTGERLWSKKVDGYFGPHTVWNGVLFSEDNSGNVIALNADDGIQLWKKNFGYRVVTGCAASGAYFALYNYGKSIISAVAAKSGSVKWRSILQVGNYEIPPVCANGHLYVSTEKGVYVLDASTGKILGVIPGQNPSLAVSQDRVYFNSFFNKTVTAVDLKTFKTLWTREMEASATAIRSYPILAGDVLFTFTDAGIFALDADSGKTLWKYTKKGRFESGAVADGKLFAVSDSGFYAFSPQALP